ncbi:DUF4062 domain-containing protein [Brucella anthropi]|uniref:DUF4062 domain-containing protein n=1 Tax=Brucella anthropi TaxID=529 RepID=UPI000289A87F|nr:DUF4062 domain-containing protein [Brucella anthropi]
MSKRPTFFLSSTIYDMRDLRSAIKFSLEARGCRVLASEFNDFEADSSKHSYEACLENIRKCDYFVLLIGSRVGGWYDKENRVSITQQEYREAYKEHKSRGLRIVTLVRSEVWQVREDRKELSRFLSTQDLPDDKKKAISDFPSKFAEDADFISRFLTEVGRNFETATAVKTGAPKPTGNWIYPFVTFKDVHDVLQPLTFSGLTADEASYRKALQYECVELVRRLLLKIDGKPLDPRPSIWRFWTAVPIEASAVEGHVNVDHNEWSRFSTLMIHLLGRELKPVVIVDALTSSVFLEYSALRSAYIPTQAYDLLVLLSEEIQLFNKACTSENLSVIYEFSPVQIGRGHESLRIPGAKLAMLVALSLRWFNILSICEGLAKHLAGGSLELPTLMPFSPIKGMQQKLNDENLTSSEARSFLGVD